MESYLNYERYFRYLDVLDSVDTSETVCCSYGNVSNVLQVNSDINEEACNDSETDERCNSQIKIETPRRDLRDGDNQLEIMTEQEFFNVYKMSKKTVSDIFVLIKDNLLKPTNRGSPVPPLIELLVTIKYLTTGSVQKKTMTGISQSTTSRINSRVTRLIAANQNRFVGFPTNADCNKSKFYEKARFPEVNGCIGTTHIGIRTKEMKGYNNLYVNEHGYHSIKVQVHKLMIEDKERVRIYKEAIMNNKEYFKDKIVMDVGAGSAILSLFCALAGAKKVYAVEASDLAKLAVEVVNENQLNHIIEVIHSKVEDVKLPDDERVDIIVSEWMGFYLLHEGMLDSVLFARDKFLKSDGALFPESATIYVAPCSVPSMYEFWDDIQGVKMKSIANVLRKNKGNKPEIMQVEEQHLLADKTALCWIDLKEVTVQEMDSFTMKEILGASKDGKYQGICIWFDCQFPVLSEDYNELPVILSTDPSSPLTHWKQTVIVLPGDQIIEKGQPIAWELSLSRSEESSRRYNLSLTLLDPEEETHPVPCSCYMTKCIVVKSYLEQNFEDGS